MEKQENKKAEHEESQTALGINLTTTVPGEAEAAARGKTIAADYKRTIAFLKPIWMAKLDIMMPHILREQEKNRLVFESVWVGQNEEYHKRLHDWLLRVWCWHDLEQRKFVWRHSLNDFGFIILSLDALMTTDRRFEKLAEEWLFEKLPKGGSAKKIKDAYHKVKSSGEYIPSSELKKIPLLTSV